MVQLKFYNNNNNDNYYYYHHYCYYYSNNNNDNNNNNNNNNNNYYCYYYYYYYYLSPKQICRQHEFEKKRMYANRAMEVKQATFTPLLFTTTGGMAEECRKHHSRLAEHLADKKGEEYDTTAIFRSALLCLRGSPATRRIYTNLQDTDFALERGFAEIN